MEKQLNLHGISITPRLQPERNLDLYRSPFYHNSICVKIEAMHMGKVQTIPSQNTGAWWDKEWTTSFFKETVTDPVWLGYEGFTDDEQAALGIHGGVDKAVCVYSQEHYKYWNGTLQQSMPMGAFGENLTLSGMLEGEVYIGDQFQIGDAVVEVSQPRQPCWKLARRWKVKNLTKLVEDTGKTGFYFRVLQHGWVEPMQELKLLESGESNWSIAACNEIMFNRKQDKQAALELSNCSLLSASWKDALYRRSQQSTNSA